MPGSILPGLSEQRKRSCRVGTQQNSAPQGAQGSGRDGEAGRGLVPCPGMSGDTGGSSGDTGGTDDLHVGDTGGRDDLHVGDTGGRDDLHGGRALGCPPLSAPSCPLQPGTLCLRALLCFLPTEHGPWPGALGGRKVAINCSAATALSSSRIS